MSAQRARPSGARLVAAYALFAAMATGVNLAVQALVLAAEARLLPMRPSPVLPALAFGTGAGLLIKYLLDKRWIFLDASGGAATHARKFSLYSAMGLATTAIFWASELIAARLDPGGPLIYLGGALGLAVGYTVKYALDRRFVFEPAA